MIPMKVIVGLGNPGKEYVGSRHNIGFELVEVLAAAHGIKLDQRFPRAVGGRGTIRGEEVILLKPMTFMNLSGEAVGSLVRRDNISLTDLLVVCDDIHLPVGRLRLRPKGSSGGQNGLKSIAAHLGTQEWSRLRLGVGEPPPGLQVEWVLNRFNGTDRKLIDELLIVAMGAAEVWVAEGIEAAMNRYNGTAGGTAAPLSQT